MELHFIIVLCSSAGNCQFLFQPLLPASYTKVDPKRTWQAVCRLQKTIGCTILTWLWPNLEQSELLFGVGRKCILMCWVNWACWSAAAVSNLQVPASPWYRASCGNSLQQGLNEAGNYFALKLKMNVCWFSFLFIFFWARKHRLFSGRIKCPVKQDYVYIIIAGPSVK